MKQDGPASCDARARISLPISISFIAWGMPSRSLISSSSGISSNRLSMSGTPMVPSISSVSFLVCGMNGIMSFASSFFALVASRFEIVQQFLVGVGVHGVGHVVVRGLHPYDPAFAVRICIDLFRIVGECGVYFEYCPRHRRINVGSSLDGFNDSHLTARFQFLPCLR